MFGAPYKGCSICIVFGISGRFKALSFLRSVTALFLQVLPQYKALDRFVSFKNLLHTLQTFESVIKKIKKLGVLQLVANIRNFYHIFVLKTNKHRFLRDDAH